MPALSVDTRVILLALLNACLLTGGVAFQKINGLRGGNPYFGPWIIVAFLLLAPTFFIGNIAFSIGGRVGLFVPISALAYVFISAVGYLAFGESVSSQQALGLFFIVAGVTLVAWH